MPDRIYKKYSEYNFYFSDEVITNYCLSLFTKPFLILSGISGTGKTKIAQLFNPYFPQEDVQTTPVTDKDYIAFKITDGILNGDGRGNFKKDHLKILLTKEEFESYEKERQNLASKDVADNFNCTYQITIIDEEGTENKLVFYVQRAQSPLVRIRFKSKKSDQVPYDLQPYMRRHFKLHDTVILKKIKDKQFKIYTTENGEFKTEAEEAFRPDNIRNIEFISVKSDWNDPSGLMGFYNIINKSYHLGPFLKHLLMAREYPDIPFFVILDEMNLAKVEYYLSDILSILETRIPNPETGEIELEEQIVLHSASEKSGEYIETNDEFFDLIPSRVTIPKNLYITGTVNIDESTYMLSPKVLDRANVIEFNEVDFIKYIADETQEEGNYYRLKSLPDFTKPHLASRTITKKMPSEILDKLMEINESLKRYNVHFGYRVLNEISLYMENAIKYIGNESKVISKALDLQILQKILPKLCGSQLKLQQPLLDIINILSGNHYTTEDSLDKISSMDIGSTKYQKSLTKIKRMYENLINQGFTSFIE